MKNILFLVVLAVVTLGGCVTVQVVDATPYVTTHRPTSADVIRQQAKAEQLADQWAIEQSGIDIERASVYEARIRQARREAADQATRDAQHIETMTAILSMKQDLTVELRAIEGRLSKAIKDGDEAMAKKLKEAKASLEQKIAKTATPSTPAPAGNATTSTQSTPAPFNWSTASPDELLAHFRKKDEQGTTRIDAKRIKP